MALNGIYNDDKALGFHYRKRYAKKISLYQAGLTRCKALYFLKVHRGTHPVFLQKGQNKLAVIR